MSVCWEDGQKELEAFCRAATQPSQDGRPSPFNPYLQPSPDRLLRASIILASRRARLEHVYSILRGKNLQTGTLSVERRGQQFATLRVAQDYCLNLQHWHDFFTVPRRAGYLSAKRISSEMTLIYTYALWLIGNRDFQLPPYTLREALARWLFMALLTGRYTGSPEPRREQDLALLRDCRSGDEFLQTLEQDIAGVLTPSYWVITLPYELATAGPQNPAQLAYFAALCILDAPVLYSTVRVRDVLSPGGRAARTTLERHHLFTREYLKTIGIQSYRDINQAANYALVEWPDNAWIGARPPSDYAPRLEARFKHAELERMYFSHVSCPA